MVNEEEKKEELEIVYGGCKGCTLCYGYNEGMYIAPAEYDPKSRTVFLRCQAKKRRNESWKEYLPRLAHIISHEVLHDVIEQIGEDTRIIDVLKLEEDSE